MQKYFTKLNLSAAVVCALCIAAYFICKDWSESYRIKKTIVYKNANASDVTMIWSINYWQKVPREFLPAGSTIKDGSVLTSMSKKDDVFVAEISLPRNYQLNYNILINKDSTGTELYEWDDNNGYSYKVFYDQSLLLRPGYFVLLAGVLPVLLLYFAKRKEPVLPNKNPLPDKFAEGIRKQYISQLDAIRAIAVLLVIVHHWLPHTSVLNYTPNGALGVNVFFVLSGFLITRILLHQKIKIDNNKLTTTSAVKNFFARRSLRIFPIYYLYLLFLFLINYHDKLGVKEYPEYYLTYTANFLFYDHQYFSSTLAHVWSLAVEEQFYLIWPWLIFLVDRKFLPYLLSIVIAVGMSMHYIFFENAFWVPVLTPACFDAFGLGGILAFFIVYRKDLLERFQFVVNWLGAIALILFFLRLFGFQLLPERTVHAGLSLWLINYCLFKNNLTVLNYIFSSKVLVFIGKISYGIYLYHLFFPKMWGSILARFNEYGIDFLYNNQISPALNQPWMFVQQLLALILLTWLSWILIERPINSLKRHFT
jgi:peptidoglycan/LPS O-acetylase OafA/YrhL